MIQKSDKYLSYGLVLFSLFIFFNFSSCKGLKTVNYGVSTKKLLSNYSSEGYSTAFAEANSLVTNSSKQNKQDYHLALLERGKIALANHDYDAAIKDLQEAEKHFIRTEGTGGFLIKENLGSLFTNDLTEDYMVEPYEMLLISPYLALAYLGKGDWIGAKVERNRTINKINQYIEHSNKSYLENPFARYVSALIYEQEGLLDDARIEYQKIIKSKPQLRQEMQNEMNYLYNKKQTTDLVVCLDVGLAPTKYEEKYGPFSQNIAGKVITVSFSYPKLKPTPSSVTQCQISINGQVRGNSQLLYNLESTVMAQHNAGESDRVKSILTRVIARLAVSVGVQQAGDEVGGDGGAIIKGLGILFGAVSSYMERADLRRWSTLPKNIQFLRIRNVPDGKQSIVIAYGKQTKTRAVNMKKNQVNLVYEAIPR